MCRHGARMRGVLRDLGVAQSAGQQNEPLLATGQQRQCSSVRGRAAVLAEVRYHRRCHRRIAVLVARPGGHGPDGQQQVLGAGVLERKPLAAERSASNASELPAGLTAAKVSADEDQRPQSLRQLKPSVACSVRQVGAESSPALVDMQHRLLPDVEPLDILRWPDLYPLDLDDVLLLAVEPEHRRQGVGRALIRRYAEVAKATGTDRVWVDAPDGADEERPVRYYSALGWREGTGWLDGDRVQPREQLLATPESILAAVGGG